MVSSVGWLAGDASTCCVCFDVVYRMRACLSIKAKIMSACCSLQSLSVLNHNVFRGVLFDEACRTAAAAMHAFPAHSTVLERCMDIYIYNRDCLSSRGCKSQYDPLLVSRRRHCRRRRIKAWLLGQHTHTQTDLHNLHRESLSPRLEMAELGPRSSSVTKSTHTKPPTDSDCCFKNKKCKPHLCSSSLFLLSLIQQARQHVEAHQQLVIAPSSSPSQAPSAHREPRPRYRAMHACLPAVAGKRRATDVHAAALERMYEM